MSDKITDSWAKGKALYLGNPNTPEITLQSIIETHPHLEQELKQLAMEWFWKGFYSNV